jgi:hypothetical protein
VVRVLWRHGTLADYATTWREVLPDVAKLHLAVDAASDMTVAQIPTDQDADDPSQVAPLLGSLRRV